MHRSHFRGPLAAVCSDVSAPFQPRRYTGPSVKRNHFLDLNEALQNPGKQLDFTIHTSLSQEEDVDLVHPIEGELSAVSTGNILLLSGQFRTRCVVECARCNEPIEVDVEFEMDDEFTVEGVPSCYGSDGFAHIVPEEEPEKIFDKNALIPDGYLRQGLILNLPVQPLCQFGWEGDCPNARATKKHFAAPTHPGLVHLADIASDTQTAEEGAQ